MKRCEICGTTNGRIAGKDCKFGKEICYKHYQQLQKYGEIRDRTSRDANEFVVNGNVVEIIIYNRKNIEKCRVLVSVKHFETVNKHKWHISSNGYVVCNSKDGDVLLHRIVMDCPSELVVDHKDHNKLNNTDENLRICTSQENNCNKIKTDKNKSGHVGVSWNKMCNKWSAQIKIHGKSKHLGLFDDINDAVSARLEAVTNYQGAFAYKEGA